MFRSIDRAQGACQTRRLDDLWLWAQPTPTVNPAALDVLVLNWRTPEMSAHCARLAHETLGGASIYIIDTHGTFVHQERGDGQLYNNIKTAMLKAQTALETRQPTSIVAAQLRNDPSGQPRQMVQFGFFTVAGGIPIVVDGEMIGAIGVGGGAGTGGDENCAIEGLKSTFGEHVLLPAYPPKKD